MSLESGGPRRGVTGSLEAPFPCLPGVGTILSLAHRMVQMLSASVSLFPAGEGVRVPNPSW